MPNVKCSFHGCEYETGDEEAIIVVALLDIHKTQHLPTSTPDVAPRANRQRAPKIERPKIADGSSEETWVAFETRWGMFTRGTDLSADERVQHLFQCCDESLGDSILKGHPTAVSGDEATLLALIKKLAVIPVPRVVRRNEVLNLKQDHGEKTRSFVARIRGKAMTCAYSQTCCSNTCTTVNDFTDVILKDVLIHGLADEDIKKEVLGWADIDDKSVEETTSFIEAKEMARDAMTRPNAAAPISSYKNRKGKAPAAGNTQKTRCVSCKTEMDKFVWNQRQNRSIECSLCKPCWRIKNPQKKVNVHPRREETDSSASIMDETSALLVGAVSHSPVGEPNSAVDPSIRTRYRLYGVNISQNDSMAYHDVSIDTPNTSDAVSAVDNTKPIVLDHHIFDSRNGWRRSESMAHPTLRLRVATDAADYRRVGVPHPNILPSHVTVVTDTGAQSCLWGLQDFYRCGFKDSDLIPVKRSMVAANREEIKISGAIFIRLSGTDNLGDTYTAPVMAYVSPSTKNFYLSREALIQLCVIPKNFPRVGAVMETAPVHDDQQLADCGCPLRTLPTERPETLPFVCSPENNAKMKEWLGVRYASSTFNKCPHQVLKGISGPELKFHIDTSAPLNVAHTPAMVPLHDMDEVKRQIDADVTLGVLEKVPYGEPSLCCHRMVVTRKADGSPRRTVDMSSLNKYCLRETHHVKPPFLQARSIPRDTWKSVTDAWNGYHSVPLREEDRYLTTFITPWGRYRYKVAPQGAAASGDAYTRRYDEIIADVERKTKCVDDTVQWDDDLTEHWWRMIDFLDLVGKNGVILNFDKFQFAEREVNFAGFRITETSVKPLEKYLSAIADFPTPTRTTDIRSWFGLIHQVSHYNQLAGIMTPFKPFLSPRKKFEWTPKLNTAFKKSKVAIIEAIKEGVEIFDLEKATCLQTDYSEVGLGYFLSQKHCACTGSTPDCCESGWRITLAGSRFLKPAESRYATVEGEALAIAWSLEQTKYFTQGCKDLTVITDHNPLVGLFDSKDLDQITNPRLFALKQRTLPWRFTTVYRSGEENRFADAASRFPSQSNVDNNTSSITMMEAVMALMAEEPEEEPDPIVLAPVSQDDSRIRAVTWDLVRQETQKDQLMQKLLALINSTFPLERSEIPQDLLSYWPYRHNLYTIGGVILMNSQVMIPPTLRTKVTQEYTPGSTMRIVIPTSLRKEVLHSLHSAHQGVTSMNERAKAGVFWPGITTDIKMTRDNCHSCNRIMPSNARTPPIEPMIPTTPFEAIACDYFHHIGNYYFVAADRLSGWVEVQKFKVGTNEAGAQGLCTALRRLMVTFGVPQELSSDGGPEFAADETSAFFLRWGITHRLSSVSFPSSNGRAELAVKTAKRLIMDNVGPDGRLDTDRMVRALLTHRNTPDPGCKLSPAQILLGRQLRDSLPYLNKEVMTFNNPQITPQWREAWKAKEDALRVRYVKTLENLSEHSRPLPPLRHGDHVMIQNQSGQFPNKWDKSGTVVETKCNDQYVIKVTGTGRLTLRNRRFLRKYTSHLDSTHPSTHSHHSTRRIDKPASTPYEQTTPVLYNDLEASPAPDIPVPSQETRSPPARSQDLGTPRRLTFGNLHQLPDEEEGPSSFHSPVVVTPTPQSPVIFVPPIRPTRVRNQRKTYDASSGLDKIPSSVPDDV